MRKIELVDLVSQYHKIKNEVDAAVMEVMNSATFIGGPPVTKFKEDLEQYLGNDAKVVPCANGTDALQISMMALGLEPGDEVITPAFTYAATAEVIALLRLKPVFADVDPATFNLDPAQLEKVITPKTKAIVPVHLYGQCADMTPILEFASRHGLFVIEDVAQAIGSYYQAGGEAPQKAGTLGHIAGTSFFPSKNLGCFGDGGAIITTSEDLAVRCKMIANHGQTSLYYHDLIGVNSRLDSIQAAVLRVKLPQLDGYIAARTAAADFYDQAFDSISQLTVPYRAPYTKHVFHQYTLKVDGIDRDAFQKYLNENGVPARAYYPVPLHMQKAYNLNEYKEGDFPVAEQLSKIVISLPMHTELDAEQLEYIADKVIKYCKG